MSLTHLRPRASPTLGSAIGVAMVIPQILRIVRHPHMGGVSPWTWAITVLVLRRSG